MSEEIQFDRAELDASETAACKACSQPIRNTYYATAGQVVCAACHDRIASGVAAGTPATRFLGALALGLGGAVVGAALWFGVRALTHLEIGLIAIAVGFLVGTGVRKGSRDVGGLPYQLLAVALTYLAVASTYVPLILAQVEDKRDFPPAVAWMTACTLALAAPFLGGLSNIIGILIIGIALYEAWRLTRRRNIVFSGPHVVASPATPTVPSPDPASPPPVG